MCFSLGRENWCDYCGLVVNMQRRDMCERLKLFGKYCAYVLVDMSTIVRGDGQWHLQILSRHALTQIHYTENGKAQDS